MRLVPDVLGLLIHILRNLALGFLRSMTSSTGGSRGRTIGQGSQNAVVGGATVDATLTASTATAAAIVSIILIDKGGHLTMGVVQHRAVVVL